MVQRFHAPTHRISQLGTTFISSRAEPFPKRRSRPLAVDSTLIQVAYDQIYIDLGDAPQQAMPTRDVVFASGLISLPRQSSSRLTCRVHGICCYTTRCIYTFCWVHSGCGRRVKRRGYINLFIETECGQSTNLPINMNVLTKLIYNPLL